jgi:CarD family transcriptional regulator
LGYDEVLDLDLVRAGNLAAEPLDQRRSCLFWIALAAYWHESPLWFEPSPQPRPGVRMVAAKPSKGRRTRFPCYEFGNWGKLWHPECSSVLVVSGRTMAFKVGDRVVYPHHGAAVITRKEKRKAPTGEQKDYLVLRMAHGEMTLAVPVDKAEEVGMRWPISKEDVEDLFEVLQRRDVREPANWSRRFKNHQEKLKSGDVYQVAEVVRNHALRDADKGLSAGEKSLFNKARNVLVSELSFALNVSEDDALKRVEKALV